MLAAPENSTYGTMSTSTAPLTDVEPIRCPHDPELPTPTPIVGPPPDNTTTCPDAPSQSDLPPARPEIASPDPISEEGPETSPKRTIVTACPESAFVKATPFDGKRPDTEAMAMRTAPLDVGSN